MSKKVPIEYGRYYHIYNRGINSCNLFKHENDYEYFLLLYEKYINPVSKTYAWCLMPNHFHFLIKIKEENEIGYYKPLNSDGTNGSVRFQIEYNLSEFEEPERVKKPNPTKHFSHLFNAYAKYFNNKYNRHGSLFEKPFRRKLIMNDYYLKYLVYYIHHNPLNHGFSQNVEDYFWNSYSSILSSKKTKIMRNELIDWFDNLNNFIFFHKQQHELNQLKELLIDDDY